MSRPASLLPAAAVLAVALAVPAAASAVTATTNQACYSRVPTRGSEPIVVTLAGGTPGANFQIVANGPGKAAGASGSASGTFDAAGNATAQVDNVRTPSGSIDPSKGQTVQLSVRDFGAGGTDVPVAQVLVTNLTLKIATKPRSPRARRRVAVSGTAFAGQRLYGFIVKPGSSKVLRRLTLGKANGCGYVSASAVVAPRGFKTGTYRIYINAGKTLRKPNAIYGQFRIFRL